VFAEALLALLNQLVKELFLGGEYGLELMGLELLRAGINHIRGYENGSNRCDCLIVWPVQCHILGNICLSWEVKS
jgi:hypothetical protein